MTEPIAQIMVRNDRKGTFQSWEAAIDETKLDQIFLDGLGSTREEAVAELKIQVQKRIEALQSIDFDNTGNFDDDEEDAYTRLKEKGVI